MRFRIRKKKAASAAAAAADGTNPAPSTAAVAAVAESADGGGGAVIAASPDRYGSENGTLPGSRSPRCCFLVFSYCCLFLPCVQS
jgi:hypothetical protein